MTAITNQFPKRLFTSVTISVLIVSGILLYNFGQYWTPFLEFQGIFSIFDLWINTILWIVLIYAIFRVFDTYILKTEPSVQEELRQTYVHTLGVITVTAFVIIVIQVSVETIAIYSAEEKGTLLNIFLILGKIVFGLFVKLFFFIYNLILLFVEDALGTVNMVIPIMGYEFRIGHDETVDQIVTIIVMFILFQRRHLIIELFTFTTTLIDFVKKILFLGNPDLMQRGIYGLLGRFWFRTKGVILSLLGFKTKPETSRGSADFASWLEIHNLLNEDKTGLVIDGINRIDPKLSDRHVTVMAPTGQGKTTNFVIPNLFSAKRGDKKSFIIADPKGDIHRDTSGYLASIGYDVRVLDLTKPQFSRTFNPLERTLIDGKLSDKEIARVADIIIDARTSGSTNQNPFFNNAAKMLLTMLIKVVKRMPEDYQNLHNLAYLVNIMGSAGEGVFPIIMGHTRNDDDQGNILVSDPKERMKNEKLRQEYMSFLSKNQETVSSIIMTAQTALKDLGIEEIQLLTATDTIAFEDIRNNNVAIFIITPPSETEFFRFFLTLFYSQLFTFCERSVANKEAKEIETDVNRIYFLMDEFGNLGKIPDFPQVITTLRSAKCSVSMIIQDIEQVRMIYGHQGASAIVNGGCASKLVFGAIQNRSMLEEVSVLMGKKTIKETRGNKGNEQLIGRDLMTPDEISRMPIGTALFLSAGKRPIKLNLTQWEDNAKLKGRKMTKVQEKPNEATIDYIPYAPSQNQEIIDTVLKMLAENE